MARGAPLVRYTVGITQLVFLACAGERAVVPKFFYKTKNNLN